MDDYIIFNKTCIYENEKTILLIQSKKIINTFSIGNSNSESYKISTTKCNIPSLPCHDYGIIIYHKNKLDNINIRLNNIILENIKIYYPFEEILKNLSTNMNIISTLVKNYNHRLDEWINYNLNLGFDKIIIFNNEDSLSHTLNEGNDYYEKMNIVTDKYKDKVYVINFPYSTFEGLWWNNIQRASLHISLTALFNKCNFCSYIDADEFIYINGKNNINTFLKNYNITLQMESNILTNKNNNDAINNNILNICNYVGEDKYTKLLIYMKNIPNVQGSNDFVKFLPSPHLTPYCVKIDKNIIMHYHCWVNERYIYDESLKYFSLI